MTKMNSKDIKLIIESKKSLVPLVSKAVRSICHTVVQDETLLYSLELCIFEAVMNVIEHSYHHQSNHGIEINIMLEENAIIFHVIDSGDQVIFPIPNPDLEFDKENIKTLPESGMGLFLIHRIMDQVTRHKIDGKNKLFMKKHLKDKTKTHEIID